MGESSSPSWVKWGLWRASLSSSWSSHESRYVSKLASELIKADRHSCFLHSSIRGNPTLSPYLSQYCKCNKTFLKLKLANMPIILSLSHFYFNALHALLLLSMASYGGELLLDSSSPWSGVSSLSSFLHSAAIHLPRSKGIHWWRRS